MIGGEYFPILEILFFICIGAHKEVSRFTVCASHGELGKINLFCSIYRKMRLFYIENVGWHHENIVPNILVRFRNVRDVFTVMEPAELQKKVK